MKTNMKVIVCLLTFLISAPNSYSVPVGEDQVAHVEITREVARRFNHLYEREPGYEDQCRAAIKKMGKKAGKAFDEMRAAWLERGDSEALGAARELIESQKNITLGDRERLLGFLEGGGRQILVEPQALLTEASKMPGLDGQKMSKSYNNTIGLREAPEDITRKLRTMPTDPSRVRRTDAGDPEKCPVWQFHLVYSGADVTEENKALRALISNADETRQTQETMTELLARVSKGTLAREDGGETKPNGSGQGNQSQPLTSRDVELVYRRMRQQEREDANETQALSKVREAYKDQTDTFLEKGQGNWT